MPVGLRSRVPAKITSSIRDPRSVLADCSPSTQEIASEMFDLPQPFGPMMAATPSPWNLSSVRSQNDLNPRICSLFSLSKSSTPVVSRQSPVTGYCGCPTLAAFARSGNFRIRCAYLPDGFLSPEFCCIKRAHSRSSHPRLDGVGINLTYCTDEIQPASSNITLYIVGEYSRPPCIAQPLQQVPGLRVERKGEVEEPREHIQASAGGQGPQSKSCLSMILETIGAGRIGDTPFRQTVDQIIGDSGSTECSCRHPYLSTADIATGILRFVVAFQRTHRQVLRDRILHSLIQPRGKQRLGKSAAHLERKRLEERSPLGADHDAWIDVLVGTPSPAIVTRAQVRVCRLQSFRDGDEKTHRLGLVGLQVEIVELADEVDPIDRGPIAMTVIATVHD